MRGNRPQTKRRSNGNGGTQWLSFSDLMSSILLIFILIMFYIMYQYFDMYEINMAEIARQQFDLDQANAELDEKSSKLTEAENQMIAQQIRLNAAQQELDDANSILAAQQEALAAAQALLGEKEIEISAQQAQIDAQQQTLDIQQQQIEQLVGLKTRIISSLSDALRAANISAQVDPTNGSIALESNVLFASGQYDLTESGQRFIDNFLPVYLNVLFSDEYRENVSEIIIEGHTDSEGTYIDNLQLSQRRALAVAYYVLDDGYRGISATQKQLLRDVVTANGRSFSDPILDAYGNEDMGASRRVVFKFRLTDEQMIQQLKSILEANDGPVGQ